MRATRLGGATARRVLVFDKGDEVVESLLAFAKQERLSAASFTAIGAFSDVTLGFFERDKRDYKRIPLDEQVEVLTLAGDIASAMGSRRCMRTSSSPRPTAARRAAICSRRTYGRRSNSCSSSRPTSCVAGSTGRRDCR